jgi:hypothetical protein
MRRASSIGKGAVFPLHCLLVDWSTMKVSRGNALTERMALLTEKWGWSVRQSPESNEEFDGV